MYLNVFWDQFILQCSGTVISNYYTWAVVFINYAGKHKSQAPPHMHFCLTLLRLSNTDFDHVCYLK